MSDFYNEPGKLANLRKKLRSFKISPKAIFIIMGLASSIWFLLRVIPKPQRAAYPCMRTAAPIMSGFVIYILSLGGSLLFFRKTIANFKKAKYLTGILSIIICISLFAVFNIVDVKNIYSNVLGVQWIKGVLPDSANMPVGEPRGINPGRVAWTFDVDATNENCTNTITDAYFMAKNTNQDTINKLANEAIKMIGGKNTVVESWSAIFKSFNKRKTGTESGYAAGQKIFIKINNGQAGWSIDYSKLSEKGEKSSGTGTTNCVMSNTSPQAVLAFLVQLIDSVGVAQNDIIIGEPMTHVYKSMLDIIVPKYPNVVFIDKDSVVRYSSGFTSVTVSTATLGRKKSSGWKADAIAFSDKGAVMTNAIKDDLMNEMYSADYLINIAVLKAHARSGVTFCAKNHFGSSTHGKSYSADRLHSGSINANSNNDDLTNARGDYHMYRVLTDLIGHDKLGGNTVLFIVDGLWGGIEATDMPVKWKMAPFNNDFPSSLFVSQDEVALESVCLDFLRAEANINTFFYNRPFFPGVDDFLHQAASRANWPDSIKDLGIGDKAKWHTFAGYDPEGDGTYMPSMGIHEHWNNSKDKEYSRNLYSNGTGIELLTYPASLVAKGNATGKFFELSITDSIGPIANAKVVINGSNYITNSEGMVTIGNFKEGSVINYSASKKTYFNQSSQITFSGDIAKAGMQLHMDPIYVNHTSISSVKDEVFSAYPNPVLESTTITYQLKSSSIVSIYLMSMEGKIVKQIKNEVLAAGTYNDNVNMSRLKTGTYICVLKAGNEIKTLKVVMK